MAGTKVGGVRIAAAKLRMTEAEYIRRVDAGEKWCRDCAGWRPRIDFTRSRSRGDGLSPLCREHDQARERARRAADLERQRAKERAKYAENPELHRARHRRLNATPERKAAKHAHYLDNKEAVYARNRARIAADPEAARAYARQDARRRRLDRDPDAIYYAEHVLAADPCAYCGAPCEQIDHIEPVAGGGANGWANLTASCAPCNMRKSANPLLLALLVSRLHRDHAAATLCGTSNPAR